MRKAAVIIVVAGMLLGGGGAASAQSGDGLISGWAFHDLDRDGVRDPGENGLVPTTICLVRHDWCDRTEWGEYMFDLLPAGTYRVRLTDIPDGFELTTRRTVRVVLDEDEILAVDFGLAPAD